MEEVCCSLKELKLVLLVVSGSNGWIVTPQSGDGGGDETVQRLITSEIRNEVRQKLVAWQKSTKIL